MELSNKTFVGHLTEVTLEKGHIDVSPFNVETSSDGTPISVDEKVGDRLQHDCGTTPASALLFKLPDEEGNITISNISNHNSNIYH